jgi:hypothetical protein
VHPKAADENPGNYRHKAGGDAEEPKAQGQEKHGAGGQPRYRHPIEKGHEQDQGEPTKLADGCHVAELRSAEMEDVLEEVGDDVVVRAVGEPVAELHCGKQDEPAACRALPRLAEAIDHRVGSSTASSCFPSMSPVILGRKRTNLQAFADMGDTSCEDLAGQKHVLDARAGQQHLLIVAAPLSGCRIAPDG